jgi:hypothetical protein
MGFRDSLAARQRETTMLLTSGIVGEARIDEVSDAGTSVNDHPHVQFTLTVSVPGRKPYPVTLSQVVSRTALPKFRPGTTVPVRVSPEDPQVLMLA